MTSILRGGQVLDIPMWIKGAPTVCPYSHVFFFVGVQGIMGQALFGSRVGGG